MAAVELRTPWDQREGWKERSGSRPELNPKGMAWRGPHSTGREPAARSPQWGAGSRALCEWSVEHCGPVIDAAGSCLGTVLCPVLKKRPCFGKGTAGKWGIILSIPLKDRVVSVERENM